MVNKLTVDSSYEIFEGLYGRGREVAPSQALDTSKHLQYWKKCSGCAKHTQELGWVVLGPVMSRYTSQEYYDFEQGKHATPLPQYGQYPAGKSSSGANSKYDVVEPERRFEPLIEQNGFREIPIDQMIAYNWHRIPVMVKYVPQLAEVQSYPCEYGCSNRVFTNPEHLKTHISVKHQNVEQPAAIGQEISKAIDAVTSRDNSMSPEAIATIVMAVREAMKIESPK